MNNLLFVEDEIDLGNVIKQYLEINDFSVQWETNGRKAFEYFTQHHQDTDLVIIDVSIPEMDGFELAEHICNIGDTPFIFLTARKEKTDKINGLKIGADDYITKPFDIDELVLRIKNILKRVQTAPTSVPHVQIQENNILQKNDVKLNKDQLTLTIGNTESSLTLREAELLAFLFRNENKILKREDILIQLWGKNDYFLGRSLDVFISRLRKHLNASESVKITNVYGIGYIFKTQ